MTRLFFILFISQWLVSCATAPIAARVQILEPLRQDPETPIYVTAARQKEAIKQSLRNAGFFIVDRIEESARLMRVTIGVTQDSQPCGTFNNVRFQLRVESRNTVEATAKGWSGTCQPNVFDEISRALWKKLFGHQAP